MPSASASRLNVVSAATTCHAESAHSCRFRARSSFACAIACTYAARFPLGCTAGRPSSPPTSFASERPAVDDGDGGPRSARGLRRRAIMYDGWPWRGSSSGKDQWQYSSK